MSEDQPVADLGRKFCSVFDAISTLLKIAFQKKKSSRQKDMATATMLLQLLHRKLLYFWPVRNAHLTLLRDINLIPYPVSDPLDDHLNFGNTTI